MDTLLESKPSEMKAEVEETTPTLETSAPFVQPTFLITLQMLPIQ